MLDLITFFYEVKWLAGLVRYRLDLFTKKSAAANFQTRHAGVKWFLFSLLHHFIEELDKGHGIKINTKYKRYTTMFLVFLRFGRSN